MQSMMPSGGSASYWMMILVALVFAISLIGFMVQYFGVSVGTIFYTTMMLIGGALSLVALYKIVRISWIISGVARDFSEAYRLSMLRATYFMQILVLFIGIVLSMLGSVKWAAGLGLNTA